MSVSTAVREKYLATIGIECHVQLATKTKLFAPVDNDARGAEPNTKVSAICAGLPGTLPVLNEAAIDLAIRAGLALNAKIANYTSFDRKHYFYPDLPKGYQITQYAEPIVGNGSVTITVAGREVVVGITRAHLEEDAGKLIHPDNQDFSLVDLNRAGTPLLEIVSEPDMHTAQEARAYARELYLLMKHAAVSDVDLYHGNMRFDVNVSIAGINDQQLGTRSETKNLNSFRSVERAVSYEIERQIEILEKGGTVIQETRGFHDATGKTFSQRSKEDAHDYRYFPDPDIPPVRISNEQIQAHRAGAVSLVKCREELETRGISSDVVEQLLEYPNVSHALMGVPIEESRHVVRVAHWFASSQPDGVDVTNLSFDTLLKHLLELSGMVESDELSSTNAKKVFGMILRDDLPPAEIAERENLTQSSDETELQQHIERVIDANPQAVADIQRGEHKALGFLVGQVMKESGGKTNPAKVKQLLEQKLLK